MGPGVERLPPPQLMRQVHWRGRSGRLYALSPQRLDDFALRNNDLFLVTRGRMVLWAGSAADVINDADSRARFRLALDCADRVFHVDAGDDEIERLTAVWDLEGAEPAPGLSAA
ncbi:MAG: hypothetical protein ROZ09_11075 [Thiobacillus sp.]|uniref:hypothetical protein n=1 Tax=Thiobacillus sp. TaxID=924 RepID=UPI002894FA73|nr:hypothetical protein [Thiobacillus sp.]MDT3707361.1 hypothetical protein [Thiobacillus sp.]